MDGDHLLQQRFPTAGWLLFLIMGSVWVEALFKTFLQVSKSPVSSKQVLPPACKPELQFCLWSFISLSLLVFFSSPMPSRFLKGGIPPSNYEISLVQVLVCTTGHETEGNRRSGFTHRCFLTFDDPLSASSSLTKPTKLLSESSSRRHKILSAYRAACSCFMRIFML